MSLIHKGFEHDWRDTQIERARNFVDWSGHIEQDIMDADLRSQLHRRGDQLIAEARRNNSNREPGARRRSDGRSVAMDAASSFEYEIRWPNGRREMTTARPVRLPGVI